MYQVQFISTGIVAYSASNRALARHWYECNNFNVDTGECLNLFKLVKAEKINHG
jgi:hypothetical protein